MSVKILLLGIGNPGYSGTRHNIGSDCLKIFEKINKNSYISIKYNIDFVNNTGKTLKKYWEPSQKLLILTDDITLNFGVIKISENVGARGHNGIRSIIEYYGKNFVQIRMGIGKKEPVDQFVLAKFNHEEQKLMPNFFINTFLVIEKYIEQLV